MTAYYNRNRPVGPGTVPRDVVRKWVQLPGEGRRPYGVYSTDRPLTDQELYTYEISVEDGL